MPPMEQTEFKFPDEQDQEGTVAQDADDTSIEIEIEDDTPPEDRGKTPMPKPLVEELERDELDAYDEKVKVKLKQMRKVWHDERREKEAALREQQEAVNLARKLLEENQRIRGVLNSGEKAFASTVQNAATLELEMAKKAYREAYDSGDAEKVLEATQALQEASYKLKQAQNFKPTALQPQETAVQIPQTQAPSVPRPDSKALAWQDRNPWFGQDDEMTAAAYGLHEKLKKTGVVIGSDEYYSALDKTMRKRFPEAFEAEEVEEQPSREAPRNKPATVVAPATRSTSSNKIRLRASQIQLAKKLGITPEQYAQAALKAEAQNG